MRDARGSPFAVLVVAVLAGAALRAFGVEFGALVQWDREGGMRVAEDVPAVPAVMAPLQEGEGRLADRRVADQRIGIWFPMFARRWPGYCPQVVDGNRLVLADFPKRFLLALGCGAPAYGSPGRGAVETVCAAVDASRRGQR